MTLRLPVAVTFSIACRMSSGARNWPFLRFTARPVRAAAAIRSVCRERNAGICRICATSATGAACAGSWMSVRMGTSAASATRASTRTPSARPGPRNDLPDVRFALSYDALKMNGTRARRAMSRSASAVSMACDSPSMTQGPAMSTSGPPPRLTPPTSMREGSTGLPYHGRRGRLPLGALVAMARLDKSGEQRVRLERLRLELGMELHGHVERMLRQLDDLDELAVERPSDDLQPLVGQRLLEQTVELVAVPVPLADHLAAVERV